MPVLRSTNTFHIRFKVLFLFMPVRYFPSRFSAALFSICEMMHSIFLSRFNLIDAYTFSRVNGPIPRHKQPLTRQFCSCIKIFLTFFLMFILFSPLPKYSSIQFRYYLISLFRIFPSRFHYDRLPIAPASLPILHITSDRSPSLRSTYSVSFHVPSLFLCASCVTTYVSNSCLIPRRHICYASFLRLFLMVLLPFSPTLSASGAFDCPRKMMPFNAVPPWLRGARIVARRGEIIINKEIKGLIKTFERRRRKSVPENLGGMKLNIYASGTCSVFRGVERSPRRAAVDKSTNDSLPGCLRVFRAVPTNDEKFHLRGLSQTPAGNPNLLVLRGEAKFSVMAQVNRVCIAGRISQNGSTNFEGRGGRED